MGRPSAPVLPSPEGKVATYDYNEKSRRFFSHRASFAESGASDTVQSYSVCSTEESVLSRVHIILLRTDTTQGGDLSLLSPRAPRAPLPWSILRGTAMTFLLRSSMEIVREAEAHGHSNPKYR